MTFFSFVKKLGTDLGSHFLQGRNLVVVMVVTVVVDMVVVVVVKVVVWWL